MNEILKRLPLDLGRKDAYKCHSVWHSETFQIIKAFYRIDQHSPGDILTYYQNTSHSNPNGILNVTLGSSSEENQHQQSQLMQQLLISYIVADCFTARNNETQSQITDKLVKIESPANELERNALLFSSAKSRNRTFSHMHSNSSVTPIRLNLCAPKFDQPFTNILSRSSNLTTTYTGVSGMLFQQITST